MFQNDAAVLELVDDTVKRIAIAPVRAVPGSGTIDGNLNESVRAAMRAKVRRLLAPYDYSPDHEDRAVELVLEQAELYALEAGTPRSVGRGRGYEQSVDTTIDPLEIRIHRC